MPRTFSDAATPITIGRGLADELRDRWSRGERPKADEFLDRLPSSTRRTEDAVELIYEEYCQREADGEPQVEADLLRRFPEWAQPLKLMLECHRRLLNDDRPATQFPQAGDAIGDFHLLEELARGAHGRVLLARQAALGDRPVVVKLTRLGGDEHLSLARLQHTNIVPLYSVTEDPPRAIRVLCMPYFGRVTLAKVIAQLASLPPSDRAGQSIVEVLDAHAAPGVNEASTPPSGPRQLLSQATHVQAVVWIAACLADALQFAHERGLLHLDLKPSNVLLASDGQPMLLDFHLARPPIRAGDTDIDGLGGTPSYMAPEQHQVMLDQRAGGAASADVDARADLFALGALLSEALGGALPGSRNASPLCAVNDQVSVGLSDIVARCLSQRPADRYSTAAVLAEDLRRHLGDRPLKGVANRSRSERWRKWRRRRPGGLRIITLVSAIGLAMLVIGVGIAAFAHERHEQAELFLSNGRRQLDAYPAEALRSFEQGVARIRGLPFENDLRIQLASEVEIARRISWMRELHKLADGLRALYLEAALPPQNRVSLANLCEGLWNRRRAFFDHIDADARQRVRVDLLEIAIFTAAAHPAAAERILDDATASLGESPAIEAERRRHLGLSARSPWPAQSVAHTSWEHFATGRALMMSGDLIAADAHLRSAVALDPAGPWSNFYHGLCAHRLGQYNEAALAFSICIGADPSVRSFYFNRSLAHAAAGRAIEAAADHAEGVRLGSSFRP